MHFMLCLLTLIEMYPTTPLLIIHIHSIATSLYFLDKQLIVTQNIID